MAKKGRYSEKSFNPTDYEAYLSIYDEEQLVNLIKSAVPYITKNKKAFDRFKESVLLLGIHGIHSHYGIYSELLDELFGEGPLVDDDMMKRLLSLDKTLSAIVIMDNLDDVRISDDQYALELMKEYLSNEFTVKSLIRTIEKGQYLVTEERLYALRDRLSKKGSEEIKKNLETVIEYYESNKDGF